MKNLSSFLIIMGLAGMMSTSCQKEEIKYIPGDAEVAVPNVVESKAPNLTIRESVDFGLPSGTLWATVNIAAKDPKAGSKAPWGDYFNWGGVVRQWDLKNSSEHNDWSNERLEAAYDAATVNWGKEWRMPTSMDFHELKINTSWEWLTADKSPQGIAGYKICGKGEYADRWIFLPAAGYSMSGRLQGRNQCGYYWTASPYAKSAEHATALYFNATSINTDDYEYRTSGFCIRPVKNKN